MLLVRTRKWQKLLHTAEPGQVVWGRGHSGKLDLKDKAPKGQDKAQEGIQGGRSGKKGVTVGILHQGEGGAAWPAEGGEGSGGRQSRPAG